MRVLIILFFALIHLPNTALSQVHEYESKEKNEYRKSRKWSEFKPLDIRQILEYQHSSLNIFKSSVFQVYADTLDFTPYQNVVHDSFLDIENKDTTWQTDKIAKISRYDILKYESLGNVSAIIYQSYEFENIQSGEPGIWIAVSLDYEENWEYLYTGIVQKQPLFLKWYSDNPLIISETELQIDGCYLRQTSAYSMPVSLHSYEVVQDGTRISIDLNNLRRDSDNDGLTDIYEAKIFTDIYNSDTDSDGILDNVDLNPRKTADRTVKTVVYEQAIEEGIDVKDTILINTNISPGNYFDAAVDSTETIFIISDVVDIYSVNPTSKRVIILSTEEYSRLKSIYNDGLNKMILTQFFEVDKIDNTYLFSTSIGSGGVEYLIKKTQTAWILEMIVSWIS